MPRRSCVSRSLLCAPCAPLAGKSTRARDRKRGAGVDAVVLAVALDLRHAAIPGLASGRIARPLPPRLDDLTHRLAHQHRPTIPDQAALQTRKPSLAGASECG